LYAAIKKPREGKLKKVVSFVAVAALALSFSATANAAPKRGDGVVNAGATGGMHQPKKAIYQKRLRTICGSASKMSGRC